MNSDHVHEMYIRLLASVSERATTPNWEYTDIARIALNRHCGNGYFSFDGILDDLTDLFGNEDLASDILNHA